MRKSAKCHPDAPNHCKGLCKKCYGRLYMRELRKDPKIKAIQQKKCREYYQKNKQDILKRARAGHRRRRYGISHEEFRAMLMAQKHCCAICQIHMEEKERDANVDHNHKTKKTRGLLCRLCNVGIGHFRDSPELLRAAAEYIEKV